MEKPTRFDSVSRNNGLAAWATEIIISNLADPNFNTDRLSDELGIAKVRMHRQIVASGSIPPATLIRKIRLHTTKAHAQFRSFFISIFIREVKINARDLCDVSCGWPFCYGSFEISNFKLSKTKFGSSLNI